MVASCFIDPTFRVDLNPTTLTDGHDGRQHCQPCDLSRNSSTLQVGWSSCDSQIKSFFGMAPVDSMRIAFSSMMENFVLQFRQQYSSVEGYAGLWQSGQLVGPFNSWSSSDAYMHYKPNLKLF